MNDQQRFFTLALILVTGFLVYILGPILTPFIAAAILAYVADPLVDKLEKYNLGRTLAASIVFVSMNALGGLLLLFLVPLLQGQILIFVQKVPGYIVFLETHFLPWMDAELGINFKEFDFSIVTQTLQENWQTAGSVATTLVASVTRSGLAIGNGIMNLTIISVVSFYLLRDWDHLVAGVRSLIPKRVEPIISSLASESDEVIGAFFRGQILVMLALGTIYSAGLSMIGLDLAIMIGLLAGLVSFVPYLGFIVGIVVACVAAIMQFHDITYLFYVIAVFGVGQVLESVLLTPLLVGDRVGLHPVAVIFAVLAGGQLFGFVGILLALPIAAVLAVIIRYIHRRYQQSELYTTENELDSGAK
jgi:predicted PurR-regulated permease PerM